MIETSRRIFLLLSIIYFFGVCTANHQNETKKERGVCYLEVPTVDLLSEDQRNSADLLKGNGSRPGYTKIQTCCIGYKLEAHTAFHCVPDCPQGCDNGNCTAPNVCECHNGYALGPKGNCVEVCPKGCLNGNCGSNNVCHCHAGYKLDPKHLYCEADCAGGCGIGGDCVSPNTCECQKGYYKNKKGKCEHFCEGGCAGGECIGPNKCSCRSGFEQVGGTCQPSCPKGCQSGVCTSPGVCTCNSGWKLNKDGNACEANCDQPCLNGFCVGPNQCACNKGYVKDPTSPNANRCVAFCEGGCPNGVCSSPNFCICNHGYVKQSKDSNVCVKRSRRHSFHPELIPEGMF